MDFYTVIKDRYACKKYSEKKVEQEKLDKILEAAKLAPTAKNLQEQHIYVCQSPEALALVDKCTPCRYGASTVLVVAYEKENVFTYPGGKHSSGVEDVTIVATHMMLAAKNEGLETCWLNFFNPEESATMLNIPESQEIVLMMDVGYPGEGAGPLPNHTSRKEVSEYTHYL